MAPTASCACRDSRRTPRETLIATARPAPTARTVTSRSETSTSAMATMAPTPTTTEPATSTTPDVTVARSSVVSAPTRDIRSPVRRRSYSATGSRSSRTGRGRRQQPVAQGQPRGEHDALRRALQQVLLGRPQRRGREQDDDEQQHRRED